MPVGLVLEGGGMRGAYTAGVLEAFTDRQIAFPYVIGVSAGALNATAFVSGQPGAHPPGAGGLLPGPPPLERAEHDDYRFAVRL